MEIKSFAELDAKFDIALVEVNTPEKFVVFKKFSGIHKMIRKHFKYTEISVIHGGTIVGRFSVVNCVMEIRLRVKGLI